MLVQVTVFLSAVNLGALQLRALFEHWPSARPMVATSDTLRRQDGEGEEGRREGEKGNRKKEEDIPMENGRKISEGCVNL